MELLILYEHYADQTRNKLREHLAKRQGRRCACCGKKTKRFCLDHDHKTGVIRGAICHRCNNGLGMLDDQIEGVEKAIAYLQNPIGQHIIRLTPPYNWFSNEETRGAYQRNHQRDADITARKNLPKRHEQRRKKKAPEPEKEPVVYEKLRLVL